MNEMVIHEVLRRRPEKRLCSECETPVTINGDNADEIDDHHVIGFTDGSGGTTGVEYATYIFCSISCLKGWTETYFQRMLETGESEGEALRTEG